MGKKSVVMHIRECVAANFYHFLIMRITMDNNDLKKILTGLSLVALLGGAGLSITGCAATANNPAGKTDNTGIDKNVRDNEGGNLSG